MTETEQLRAEVERLTEREAWADGRRVAAEQEVIGLRIHIADLAAEHDAHRRELQARNSELVEANRALRRLLADHLKRIAP